MKSKYGKGGRKVGRESRTSRGEDVEVEGSLIDIVLGPLP